MESSYSKAALFMGLSHARPLGPIKVNEGDLKFDAELI